LYSLLNDEKIYLDPNISLHVFSNKIGVTAQILSAFLNEELDISFNDLINKYRVEEFKKLINQPENEVLTIIAVAKKCGFNSKSSFNRAFKKFIGTTPSDYFKSIKQ
jgi:AraC-like DNA-binding protein